MCRERQVLKWPKVRHYYFFRAQARPVFLYQKLLREGLKFISIMKSALRKSAEKNFKIFFWKIRSSKMDFRHFAWAKSCNFLRDDLTHLGDPFKLLISKIGDRPVGPYLYSKINVLLSQYLYGFSMACGMRNGHQQSNLKFS